MRPDSHAVGLLQRWWHAVRTAPRTRHLIEWAASIKERIAKRSTDAIERHRDRIAQARERAHAFHATTPFENLEPRILFSTIDGSVFVDLDLDLLAEPGEFLSNWVVYIDEDGDDQYDAGQEPHATTNASGQYTFTGLVNGNYVLRTQIDSSVKWDPIAPNLGWIGDEKHVVIAAGVGESNVDFRYFTSAYSSITSHADTDSDGRIDVDEGHELDIEINLNGVASSDVSDITVSWGANEGPDHSFTPNQTVTTASHDYMTGGVDRIVGTTITIDSLEFVLPLHALTIDEISPELEIESQSHIANTGSFFGVFLDYKPYPRPDVPLYWTVDWGDGTIDTVSTYTSSEPTDHWHKYDGSVLDPTIRAYLQTDDGEYTAGNELPITVNLAPEIALPTDQIVAYVDEAFNLYMDATDANGDALTYTASVSGNTPINPVQVVDGWLQWTPVAGDLNKDFTITVSVSDGHETTEAPDLTVLVRDPAATTPNLVYGSVSGQVWRDLNEDGMRNGHGVVATEPVDIVFVIDTSASTARAITQRHTTLGPPPGDYNGDHKFNTTLDAELKALEQVVNALPSGSRVKIVTFDVTASIVDGLFTISEDPASRESVVSALKGVQIATEWGTSFYAGLKAAQGLFQAAGGLGENPQSRHLIFISDADNGSAGNYGRVATSLRDTHGVQINAVGIGKFKNLRELREVSPSARWLESYGALYSELGLGQYDQWVYDEEPYLGLNVYIDTDHDGEQDEDEPTVDFDANGQYSIADALAPGSYIIRANVSEGLAFTNLDSDSYIITIGSDIPTVDDVVEGAHSYTNLDFGVYFPPPPSPPAQPPANNPPTLDDYPDGELNAQVGQEFYFNVIASDADAGDTLTFSLSDTGVDGPTINPSTGEIAWTPVATFGGQTITGIQVTVSDGTDSVSHTFDLAIAPAPIPDLPPRITSEPVTRVYPGNTYTYQVVADDDLGIASYTLISPRYGMSIDAQGLIEWIVPTAATGKYLYPTIEVTDTGGHKTRQRFRLRVETPVVVNEAPRFQSTPIVDTQVLSNYEYFAFALDPEGESVTYTLSAPAEAIADGLAINEASGVVSWTPSAAWAHQTIDLSITAEDQSHRSATQVFSISVAEAEGNTAPIVISNAPTGHLAPLPTAGDATIVAPVHVNLPSGTGDTVTVPITIPATATAQTIDIVILSDSNDLREGIGLMNTIVGSDYASNRILTSLNKVSAGKGLLDQLEETFESRGYESVRFAVGYLYDSRTSSDLVAFVTTPEGSRFGSADQIRQGFKSFDLVRESLGLSIRVNYDSLEYAMAELIDLGNDEGDRYRDASNNTRLFMPIIQSSLWTHSTSQDSTNLLAMANQPYPSDPQETVTIHPILGTGLTLNTYDWKNRTPKIYSPFLDRSLASRLDLYPTLSPKDAQSFYIDPQLLEWNYDTGGGNYIEGWASPTLRVDASTNEFSFISLGPTFQFGNLPVDRPMAFPSHAASNPSRLFKISFDLSRAVQTKDAIRLFWGLNDSGDYAFAEFNAYAETLSVGRHIGDTDIIDLDQPLDAGHVAALESRVNTPPGSHDSQVNTFSIQLEYHQPYLNGGDPPFWSVIAGLSAGEYYRDTSDLPHLGGRRGSARLDLDYPAYDSWFEGESGIAVRGDNFVISRVQDQAWLRVDDAQVGGDELWDDDYAGPHDNTVKLDEDWDFQAPFALARAEGTLAFQHLGGENLFFAHSDGSYSREPVDPIPSLAWGNRTVNPYTDGNDDSRTADGQVLIQWQESEELAFGLSNDPSVVTHNTGGLLWNAGLLSLSDGYNHYVQAFSNALADWETLKILDDIDIIVDVLEPHRDILVEAVTVSGESIGLGGNVVLEVELVTPELPTTFNLLVSRGGQLLDEVPVTYSEPYVYEIKALDADGDALTYAFAEGSNSFGAVLEGSLLTWLPDQSLPAGDYTFFVEVSDGRGGTALHQWTVTLQRNATGSPPVVDDVTALLAGVDREFSFTPTGADVGVKPLMFFLRAADGETRLQDLIDSGLQIDRNTGTLSWSRPFTPTMELATNGTSLYELELVVYGALGDIGGDAGDGRLVDPFTLDIDGSTQNVAPVFVSTEAIPTQIDAGELYHHRVLADDPNLERLTFTAPWAPSGFQIDEETGWVTWTTVAEDAGTHDIMLMVRDDFGEIGLYQYQIEVIPNRPPVVVTPPRTRARAGEVFTQDFRVVDPEGRPGLSDVSFASDRPTGWTLEPVVGSDNVWRLSSPAGVPLLDDEVYPVTLAFKDEGGLATSVPFIITVSSVLNNQAPVLLNQPRATVSPGQTLRYRPAVFDADGDGVSITVSGAGTWYPSDGYYEWSPEDSTVPGDIRVELNDGYVAAPVITDFPIAVDDSVTNRSPSVIQPTAVGVIAGQTLQLPLSAVDPDNDAVTWSIETAPSGVTVDPLRGILYWTASEYQLGTHELIITASDAMGGVGSTRFEISVRSSSTAPYFGNTPQPRAVTGELYYQRLDVADAESPLEDLEVFAYDLPQWLSLEHNPDGWYLTGTAPSEPEAIIGEQWDVKIRAFDPLNRVGTLSFIIELIEPGAPLYPQITLLAKPSATNDTLFELPYAVDWGGQGTPQPVLIYSNAIDIENDVMHDPTNGVLSWTIDPEKYPAGRDYPLWIVARKKLADGDTFVTNYSVEIFVAGQNSQPSFPGVGSDDSLTIPAVAGQSLAYAIPFEDADGDSVTFTPSVESGSLPAGMSISNGVLTWNPVQSAPDIVTVTITARDTHGATAMFDLNIDVRSDAALPTAAFIDDGEGDTPSEVFPGQPFTVVTDDDDDTGIVSRVLEVRKRDSGGALLDPTTHRVGENGRLSMTLLEPGSYQLKYIVTDTSGNQNVETVHDLTVSPNRIEGAPTILSYPTDLPEVVEAVTSFSFSTEDHAGNPYGARAYLVPAVGGNAITVYEDIAPAVGEAVAHIVTVNPGQVADGAYRLRFEVTDDSNSGVYHFWEETISIGSIAGAVKDTAMVMAYSDLSVNLGGIALPITRSYDAKKSGVLGAFGYGWEMAMFGASVQASHGGVSGSVNPLYQPFTDATIMTIELPTGGVERFAFNPKPSDNGLADLADMGYTGGGLIDYVAAFDNVLGGTAKLELTRKVRLTPSPSGAYATRSGELFGLGVEDFDLILTSQDQTVYRFDGEDGLLICINTIDGRRVEMETILADITVDIVASMLDPNDPANRVETDRVRVTRNSELMITSMARVQPDGTVVGQQLAYAYDTSGNLISVSRNEQADPYAYEYDYGTSSEEHLIHQMKQDGVVALTSSYLDESNGRIESLADVSGASANVLEQPRDVDDLGIGWLPSGLNYEGVNQGESLSETLRNDRGNIARQIRLVSKPDPELASTWVYEVTFMEYADTVYPNQATHVSRPTIAAAAERFTVSPPPTDGANGSEWRTITTYWPQSGLPKDVTQHPGTDAAATTRSFYDDGRLVLTIDPLGYETRNRYDQMGRLQETTDPLGNSTRYHYDATGNIKSIDQVGVITDSATGQKSELVVVTSQNGYTLGRLTSATEITGQTRFTQYDVDGRAVIQWHVASDGTNDVAVASITKYDSQGRVIASERHALDSAYDLSTMPFYAAEDQLWSTPLWSTSTSYDGRGQVVKSVDRYGAVTWTTYDDRGLLIETATQGSVNGTWFVQRTVYDAQGRSVYATDAELVEGALAYVNGADDNDGMYFDGTLTAGATKTTYDLLGRAVETERLKAVTISLTGVDSSEPGDGIADGEYATTASGACSYSIPQRSVTVFNDDGSTDHTVEYGASVEGVATKYLYDAAGRQHAVIHNADLANAEGFAGVDSSVVSYAYDALGRQGSVAVDPVWNPADRVYEAGAASVITRSVYDALGRVTSSIAPDGTATTTEYDGFGRRVAEVDPLGRRTDYVHDNAGRLVAVVLPEIAIAHSALGDLAEDAPGVVRPRYEYRYDTRGNQTAIIDNVLQWSHDGTVYKSYDLGANAQTLDATEPSLSVLRGYSSSARVTEFSYDAFGRQVSRTLPEGQTEYKFYDDTNPLGLGLGSVGGGQLAYELSFEGVLTAYAYDNRAGAGGRLVSRTRYDASAAEAVASGQSLTWSTASADEISSAIGAEEPDPVRVTTYTYDADGRSDTVTRTENGVPVTISDNDYDSDGNQTSVATPEGTVYYEYDELGRTIRTYTGVDGNGHRHTDTRFTYDEQGRLLKVTDLGFGSLTPVLSDRPVVLADSSANGHHVRVTGDPTWATGHDGLSDTAIELDGDDGVVLDDGTDYVHAGFGDRGIAMWFNPSLLDGTDAKVLYEEGNDAKGFVVALVWDADDTAWRVQATLTDDGNVQAIVEVEAVDIATDQWYHITASYHDDVLPQFDDLSIYLRHGSQMAIATPASQPSAWVDAHADGAGVGFGHAVVDIGGTDTYVTSHFFTGIIDDVRVFGDALLSEANALHLSGLPGGTDPGSAAMEAHWTMDRTQRPVTYVLDVSGNENHLDVIGAPGLADNSADDHYSSNDRELNQFGSSLVVDAGEGVVLDDATTPWATGAFSQRTISFRFKYDTALTGDVILYEEGDTNNGLAIRLDRGASGQPDKVIARAESSAIEVTTAHVLLAVDGNGDSEGVWHNVTLVFDGDTSGGGVWLTLYADGLSATANGTFDADGQVGQVGPRTDGGIGFRNGESSIIQGGNFAGEIDEFRVYDIAMSALQVATLAGDDLVAIGRLATPLAYYDFNAEQTTLYDHDAAGRLERLYRSNGIVEAYAYDAMGRTTTLGHYQPIDIHADLDTAHLLAYWRHEYLADGNLALTREILNSEPSTDLTPPADLPSNTSGDIFDDLAEAPNPYTGHDTGFATLYLYSYDALGRLVEEAQVDRDTLPQLSILREQDQSFVRRFDYDYVGNRTTQYIADTVITSSLTARFDAQSGYRVNATPPDDTPEWVQPGYVFNRLVEYTYDDNDRLLTEASREDQATHPIEPGDPTYDNNNPNAVAAPIDRFAGEAAVVRDAERGAVLQLDPTTGAADYIDLSDAPWTNSQFSTRTIALWIKAPSFTPDYQYLYEEGGTNGIVLLLAGDKLQARIRSGTSQKWVGTPTAAGLLNTDTWHHIVLVDDGLLLKLYIDGRRLQTAELEGNNGAFIVPPSDPAQPEGAAFGARIGTNDPYTGNSVTGDPRAFHGLMDDARLYADALTDDEVRKLYVGTHHDLENDAEASAMAPANAFDAPRDHLLAHHSFDHQTVTQYEYGYDAGSGKHQATQQTRKTVHIGTSDTDPKKTEIIYEYDAAGRMSRVTTTTYEADGTTTQDQTVVTYEYNDAGIRTRSIETEIIKKGTPSVALPKITDYLTDTNNPTGYPQVLEQREGTDDNQDGTLTPTEINQTLRNLLAHDILVQIAQNYEIDPQTNLLIPIGPAQVLAYLNDAGGSTRALLDPLGIATETYRYTAYGMAVGFDKALALTQHQYRGELHDPRIGYSYNRLRFYDYRTGRLNRLDLFAGDSSNPATFNKYGYSHGNPVLFADPTGLAVYLVGRAFKDKDPLEQQKYNQYFTKLGLAHVYLLFTDANDINVIGAASWHPYPFFAQSLASNNRRPGRVWFDDPNDMFPVPRRITHQMILVTRNQAEQQAIENNIQSFLTTYNKVGIEYGAPTRKKIPGYASKYYYGGSSPNGKIPKPGALQYWVGGQNCAWWATEMLRGAGIPAHRYDLALTNFNRGAGIRFQINSNSGLANWLLERLGVINSRWASQTLADQAQ